MHPFDLIRSRDGSLSLTKLAASTAHLLMAAGFALLTYQKGFIAELWMIYSSAAIFHASYDKTISMVKDFQDRKLAGAPSP